MVDYSMFLDDDQGDEERSRRNENYRQRRTSATRQRTRATKRKASTPGGIRQRRNKHWNW
jgi:hypothetical protein